MRFTSSSSRLIFGDALADQPAVGLDLGFARAAEEAEAAALAFEMGPALHQPRALIGEMGQLDLQAPFARPGPLAEDFQDERRAVEHLGAPGLLQIALLHRREAGIDDDDFGFKGRAKRFDLIGLARPDQRRRHGAGDRRNHRMRDFKPDGGGERHRLFQPRLLAPAPPDRVRGGARFARNVQHDRAPRFARRVAGPPCALCGALAGQVSVAPPESGSWSWIGPIGITVEIACL